MKRYPTTLHRVILINLILCGFIGPATAAQNPVKPNMIYVMLDDAGYGDFGAFGSRYIKTPVFDRLCREGMKFTQHYSGSAVCAPTRCVLMTGLHTGHCRRRDNTAKARTAELSARNGRPLVFLEKEDLTIAETLSAAGYMTGGIGKWGLGNPGSEGVPEKQGFGYWFGYLDQVHAHDHFPDEIWEHGKMMAIDDNRNDQRKVYIPYLQEQKALNFIRRNQNQPFFLYLALTPPHGKYIIPETDPTYAMYEGIPGGDQVRHYAAMITRTDQTVGKVLNLIKDLDLDENTIVFYTSDNGPNTPFARHIGSSGGLRGIKRQLYEGGIRAAMAVRWPGRIPAGKTSDFIWDMRDVFPTLCDIAGVEIPLGLDGMSVFPTLQGKPQTGREFHYWEIHSPFQQAVRMGRWKGIRFGTKESLSLFDLGVDLREQNDVAAGNPDLIRRMEQFLSSARTESVYFPAREKAAQKNRKKR